MNFILNNKLPVFLVDTSYVSFHRFYATMFWYKKVTKQKTLPDEFEPFDENVFMDKYKLQYIKAFEKVFKKLKIHFQLDLYKNFVFAMDCSRKKIWRSSHFKEYKENRDEFYKSKKWKGGKVLRYTHKEYISQLCKKIQSMQCKHPHLEGDDIIALFKEKIRTQQPNRKIIIITNDHDLLQLIDDNTIIINLQQKILNEKSLGNPRADLLMKVLCGDPSDNIKKCFKKCGKKTAMKYIHDDELLQKHLENDPEAMEKYKFNCMMIDFKHIPTKLKDELFSTYFTDHISVPV